jgi:hypothetical protein
MLKYNSERNEICTKLKQMGFVCGYYCYCYCYYYYCYYCTTTILLLTLPLLYYYAAAAASSSTLMNLPKLGVGFLFLIHWPESMPTHKNKKQTPWPQSASDLYRPIDHRLSAKLVPTFSDRGLLRIQRGGSRTTLISVFLDLNCYIFFQVAPHLYSWGWVDPFIYHIQTM